MNRGVSPCTIVYEVKQMMNYKEYPHEIESAWRILLDCNIKQFPVSVKEIAHKIGIPVLRYSQSQKLIDDLKLSKNAARTDGMTVPLEKGPIIFYDDSLSAERCRVTIGHEIGHIVMDHIEYGCITPINRSPSPLDNQKEFEANLFCEQLIAPSCVLLEVGAMDNESIERLCHVTRKASDFIIARMKERSLNYSICSSKELAVLRNFLAREKRG